MSVVLVLGGGYAGIMAANQLIKSKAPARVILINDRSDFQEKIRNHQVLAGTLSEKYSLRKLLHPQVQFVESRAVAIQPEESLLKLEDTTSIPYDYLIYAAGMEPAGEKPPSAEYAFVADTKECARMSLRLKNSPDAKISVVGGGLSGIETAAELAESYPGAGVTLIDPGPFGENFSQKARQYMFDRLTRKGVFVLQDRIVAMEPGRLRLASGSVQEHDHCILATGVKAPSLAVESGLKCDESNRVIVDPRLHATPRILACGDAAVIGANPLRMSCAMALPMGAYAGRRVASLLRNKGANSKEFHQDYTVRCVSLGRKKGLIQFLHADDSPRNFVLKNGKGAIFKERVCKYTIKAFD